MTIKLKSKSGVKKMLQIPKLIPIRGLPVQDYGRQMWLVHNSSVYNAWKMQF